MTRYVKGTRNARHPSKWKRLIMGLLMSFVVGLWISSSLHVLHQTGAPTTTQQQVLINPVEPTSVDTYYSHTRGDRAGSAILDMLTAHAYAFRSGKRYGGACGNTSYVTIPTQRRLIATLGLTSELPFSCPSSTDRGSAILEFNDYTSQESVIFSTEWLAFIRSKAREFPRLLSLTSVQIVVHVRRGDVTFCGNKYKRYFPNQYYLDLIEEYKPKQHKEPHYATATNIPSYNVTVLSNAVDPIAHNAHEPKEPWEDFTSRGYHVRLGADVEQDWWSMITADVFIMSKSAFSHVPAIFNDHGRVVYTAYWTEPIPGWEVVPRTKSREALKLVRKMWKRHCNRTAPMGRVD